MCLNIFYVLSFQIRKLMHRSQAPLCTKTVYAALNLHVALVPLKMIFWRKSLKFVHQPIRWAGHIRLIVRVRKLPKLISMTSNPFKI